MYIPTLDDLKLVPINDLISEIKNRHNGGMILALMLDDPSFQDRDWEVLFDGTYGNVNLLKEYINRACSDGLDSVFYGGIDE